MVVDLSSMGMKVAFRVVWDDTPVSGHSPSAREPSQELRFAILAPINQDGTDQRTTMWYLLEGQEPNRLKAAGLCEQALLD